jgi:calcineurin-like phosphoesterase family protein
MAASMIARWNEVVMPDDIVYVLGDATMGQREFTLKYIGYLNGHKYLVPGNHDYVHPAYAEKKSFENHQRMYLEVFDDILDPQVILEDMFLLCHFPYNVPNQVDYQGRDYSEWEPKDEGRILLCGHVHDSWSHRFTDQGTLQINVGVDVRDFRPISFEHVKSLVSTLEQNKN